jgi:hypothetical protein
LANLRAFDISLSYHLKTLLGEPVVLFESYFGMNPLLLHYSNKLVVINSTFVCFSMALWVAHSIIIKKYAIIFPIDYFP